MVSILRRLVATLRGGRRDAELVEEIEAHIAMRTRALVDDGMPPAAAEREARRQFGNVAAIRERAREVSTIESITATLQDLRIAARGLRRTPGIASAIVLTIALGSGLNAAVFLVIKNVVLRPANLPGADTLAWLDDGRPLSGPTYPDYVDYRDRTTAFSNLAAYAATRVSARLAVDEEPQGVRTVLASGNYFAVLRGQAAIGRTFGSAEDRPPQGAAVVVLSDAYWARRFNRDPGALGRTIDLNFAPFTIVGIMPADFSGARSPNGDPYVPDVWVPIWSLPRLEPGDNRLRERQLSWGLQSIGRLRDGGTIAEARAQVAAVAAALDHEHAGQGRTRTPWVVGVTSVDPRFLRTEPGLVAAVFGTVSLLILLVACANVAGLLIARASMRRREVAVRLSLGASRSRILQLFLAEGLLFALAGTTLGHILASWAVALVLASGDAPPVAWSFAPDGRTLAFALLLTLIATIGTGLMPAIQASRTALQPALGRITDAPIGRLRGILVGAEVAASAILLIAAALMVRGLVRAHGVEPQFPVDRLAAVEVDARLHGYQGERLAEVYRSIRREIETLPGVVSTALMEPGPFSGSQHNALLRRAEASDAPPISAYMANVSSAFFAATDMQLVGGRWFDEDVSDEIVVSESLAARLWPGASPLGARVIAGTFNGTSHTVVGVARDVEFKSLRDRHEPLFFRPGRGGAILVRTAGPAQDATRALRAAVARVDARLMTSVTPLADGIAGELQAGRAVMFSAAGVGGLALLLALAGVAATAAQSVAARTQEIGIRMALGARRRDAVSFIVRRALIPVTIGAAVAIAIASQASRVLSGQLYGVSGTDPVAFAGSVIFILASAAAAAWIPARRAASIDPLIALRAE